MENESSFQDMISIILTITFLLFSYNEVMPRVSYLKVRIGLVEILNFWRLRVSNLRFGVNNLRFNPETEPTF
jgi:hypothetical protein